VTAQLRKHGHEVRQVDDDPRALDADVVLMLRNARWYPQVTGELDRRSPDGRPLVTVWHREPLPPPRASGLRRPGLNHREVAKILLRDRRITDVYSNARRLRRLARAGLIDVLVASTRARQEYLLEQGLEARWAPNGYEPSYGRDLNLERDIDVFFVGALDIPRRRRRIRSLRRRGVDLMAVGDWHSGATWGKGRTRLLNRSKILLNIARHPGDLADTRFLLGMSNGALVISEPVYRPEPFEHGRHYVSATVDEMPEVIDHYLRHEDERRAILERARRFVTEEYTLERAVRRILGFIGAALAEGGARAAGAPPKAPP
jgi:glycosyltransferase involved in cell wall biosynthesis